MDEPVSWEYVMLLDEADLNDFFSLLKEPELARYVHASPNRWRIYGSFVVGAAQIAWRAITATVGRRLGRSAEVERVVIQLPPPSMLKKRKKKRAYRRRLSTTTIEAPSMTGGTPTDATGATRAAGGA